MNENDVDASISSHNLSIQSPFIKIPDPDFRRHRLLHCHFFQQIGRVFNVGVADDLIIMECLRSKEGL